MTPFINIEGGSPRGESRYPLFQITILEADQQFYVEAARLTRRLIINFPVDQSGVEEGKLAIDIRGRMTQREAFFNKVKELKEPGLESA